MSLLGTINQLSEEHKANDVKTRTVFLRLWRRLEDLHRPEYGFISKFYSNANGFTLDISWLEIGKVCSHVLGALRPRFLISLQLVPTLLTHYNMRLADDVVIKEECG